MNLSNWSMIHQFEAFKKEEIEKDGKGLCLSWNTSTFDPASLVVAGMGVKNAQVWLSFWGDFGGEGVLCCFFFALLLFALLIEQIYMYRYIYIYMWVCVGVCVYLYILTCLSIPLLFSDLGIQRKPSSMAISGNFGRE